MPDFSVLMSLYSKEKPEYLKDCLNSVLEQTVKPSQIVIVKDGPLTEELESVLELFISTEPDLYTIIPLEYNQGLGLALREGILHCKYELIARMDTDDIARKDRFEIQLAQFEKNPELDICGSHIIEIEGSIDNKLAKRIVPLAHEDIARYQKKRSAFNHMTVMYKKSAVLKAGNYEHCPLMEDDMLWVRMLISGAICSNVDDYLVYARTGLAMIERRGGWAYFKKYKTARKRIYRTGYISWLDYEKTILVQFVVALIPKKMRLWFFKKLLRK